MHIFYEMFEKRSVKVSFRMTESMYLARQKLHDAIREALGIPNLCESDIVELFLNACSQDEQVRQLIVNRVAEAAKQKYKI